MKQRDLVRMSPEEVDAFLHEQRTLQVATMGKDGSIHLVAMWYGIIDGAPCFETKLKSQKVQNLRRDNRITCLFEDGDKYEELRGVQFVGTAEVVEDQDFLRQIGLSMAGRYFPEMPDDRLDEFLQSFLHNRVGVRINVDRVASWDHSKLGRG